MRSAAAAAAALRRVGSGRRRAAGRIAAGGGDRHGGLRLAFTVEGHAGPVRTVAVDTSGQLLSGGDDGLARWWDVADGRAVGAVACGGGVLEAVRTEGLWVVAGGRGALVLDPREDRPTGRLGARGGVTLLAAASTGEGSARVWTGGGGGVLRLWDARTGARPLREVRATHAGGATCLAGAKRGGREVLYTGGRDHTVREVRAAGRSRRLEPPHYDAVTRLLACPSFVYSGARDGSLRWWGEDGSAGGMAGLHRGGVSGLAAGREGGGVLLSCGRDGTVREWGADGARTLITHEAALLALQPAPDGRTVYTGAADGRVLAYLHTPPHAHSYL